MNETYRKPNQTEREIIKRLLEKDFPGRPALMKQLDGLMVKRIDEEGSLSLKVDPLTSPAEVKERIVAEACYSDEDHPSSPEGPQVRILLHVVNGRLTELEVYKDDGSPVKKPPLAQSLICY